MKLPERTNYFYQSFLDLANKNNMHSLDWKRFYYVIDAAQKGRTKLTRDQLEKKLMKDGFSERVANQLGSIYYHGRNLLKSRLMMNYVKWKKNV